MADLKISQLTAISVLTPATDVLPVVDVGGVTKKITTNQILGSGGTATLASATITGDLTAARLIVTGGTIPTNGLWLPTTNTLEFAANSLAQYRIAPLGVFSWYDGAGGTRMTLNSTGLGVGDSPSYKLHVAKTTDGTLGYFRRISGTINPALTVYCNETGNTVGFGTDYAGATSPSITFTTGGAERVRIDSSGLVGIGVTPANDKLLVSQTIGILLSGATSDFSFRNSGGTAIQRLRYTDATGALTIGSATGTSYAVELGGNTTTRAVTIDTSGNLILQSSATPATLATNGQLTVNATSNTNLRFSYRGSDGTTRVANITLA